MSETELYMPFADPVIKYNDLNLDNKTILKDINKVKFKPTTKSEGTYISQNLNIFSDLKENSFIKDTFIIRIKHALIQFGYASDIKIGNCWATLTKPKSRSHFHLHSNYWLSACYYPMGSVKDGFAIKFKRPSPLIFDVPKKNFSSFNSVEFKLNIKEGDFIVFPSYLEHQIDDNKTKYNRYSLAMVINPMGIIGSDDSLIDYSVFNK